MTLEISAAKKFLQKDLIPQYGDREASNIVKIVFEDVFANDQGKLLSKEEIDNFNLIRKRLISGEPLQYILGYADFYGLKLNVSSDVLIPRPETEELVHWIIKDVGQKRKNDHAISILDIGTGSGCIPLALKKHLPEAIIHGIDVSKEALRIAELNGKQTGLDVDWINLDILNEKDWSKLGKFDLIVSNPPYIPDSEKALMHSNVLEFEPHLALFVADDDRLLFYRRIMEFAKHHLNEGASLYFEINEFLAKSVEELFEKNGFINFVFREDMQGKPRMAKAELSAGFLGPVTLLSEDL